MQPPIILWKNLLAEASTLVASTQLSTAYPVANVVDNRTYTFWKAAGSTSYYIEVQNGSSKPADILGVCSHNLYSIAAQLTLQRSTTGTTWQTWSTFSITTDEVLLSTFTPTSATHYRLVINCAATATVRIGVLSLGTSLRYIKCPIIKTAPANESIKSIAAHSQTGIMLGSIIKYFPQTMTYTFQNLPTTFFFTSSGASINFGEFWKNHGRYLRPFFIGLSLDTYPHCKYFARFDDTQEYTTPLEEATLVSSQTLNLISCLASTEA